MSAKILPFTNTFPGVKTSALTTALADVENQKLIAAARR